MTTDDIKGFWYVFMIGSSIFGGYSGITSVVRQGVQEKAAVVAAVTEARAASGNTMALADRALLIHANTERYYAQAARDTTEFQAQLDISERRVDALRQRQAANADAIEAELSLHMADGKGAEASADATSTDAQQAAQAQARLLEARRQNDILGHQLGLVADRVEIEKAKANNIQCEIPRLQSAITDRQKVVLQARDKLKQVSNAFQRELENLN